MKTIIRMDNTKVDIQRDGRVKSQESSVKPSQPAVFEVNTDMLNLAYMAYDLFPPFIRDYLKQLGKVPLKPAGMPGKPALEVPKIPEGIPATGHDIYNYVARFGSANFQIQAVLKLNGRLDYERLMKAVRLTMDAEPVFGSRLIHHDPPYWKQLDDLSPNRFCSFENAGNLSEAIQRFLETPLDMDRDPMVLLRLIRTPSKDALCLKFNHSCCDGTGAKEYLELLTKIYNNMDAMEGAFVPKRSNRSRKDQDLLFDRLGIKDPDTAWDPLLDVPKKMWEFPWKKGGPENARCLVCKLPPGHVDALSEYGKARGSTVNDLILTALFRAMFQVSNPPAHVPMDISQTVDLRRYLPDQKTDGIRNFSGGFDSRIARVTDETFDGTLARITAMMNEIKKCRLGLQSAVGLERVEKARFSETLAYYQAAGQNWVLGDQCSPVLSNLGLLNKSLLRFGRSTVTDAYIVPPAVCAPGILICVGTYNEILTFAMSFYETQINRENMARILELIRKELVEGCV